MKTPKRAKGLKERGLIFVISAPSGAGKTTLLRKVMKQLPDLQFSVSYTTRPRRSNEQPGKDYHFVSPSVFDRMLRRGEFLEWTEVSGSCYGTAKPEIQRLISGGKDLILDIDSRGARKIMREMNPVVLIYILPPSIKTLTQRLVARNLDPPQIVKLRLANIRKEMKEAWWYHYLIINNHIEEAADKLKSIFIAERCRRDKPALLKKKKIVPEG
jgi:guanylate kinase